MFFIPHTAVSTGRKATYLRIVAKIRPEKRKKNESALLLAATALTILAKSALPPQTSLQPNASSTA
jgi:hypothetical protein